jgi:hypothetical protein
MKPSKRILILAIVVELLLAGGAWFLVSQLQGGTLTPNGPSTETMRRIGEVFGAAMGGLGGVFAVLYIVLRIKERKGTS